MQGTSLSGSCLDNGVDRKGIPFLTLPCLRLLIFCFGFDVTVDYQYLLLWAKGPCCLQFLSVLLEISISPVLQVLLQSFQAEAPIREVRPPSWDLNIVSSFLRSSSFQPWTTISLRTLTRRPLFLLSLVTAKRGGGVIQALSRRVSFSSSAAGLSYVPGLVAKTESALRPLPRSFEVPSLGDFAAGMPEELLRCPVRAFSEYLDRTSGIVNRPRRLSRIR